MQSRKRNLSDIVTRLSLKLDDVAGARWAVSEKQEAINIAIQAAWPRWWEIVDVYPLTTYDYDVFAYPLPEGLDDVIAVYFEPQISDRPWWLVRKWHVDGDILYIQESFKDYQSQNIRLVGVRAPWEFNTKGVIGTTGVIVANGNELTVSGADFVVDGVLPGDCLWLTGGCADADKKFWLVRAVGKDAAKNVLVVNGKFSASASGVSYNVNYYTFVAEMYLVHKAASELFQFSGHKGAGQDIVEDMQWAEFHAQMAEYYIDMQGKPYPSRRTA